MEGLSNVEFLQGDFKEESVMQQFLHRVQLSSIDVVISDMAPNFSGMRSVDQPRAMYLAELALDFTQQVLRPKGCFVIKTFQGEGFETFLKELRRLFTKVIIRKPSASRGTSAEVYLVAVSYNQTK
jgi:23S rRNA (uridine2552-2'-O)-methyltransferase